MIGALCFHQVPHVHFHVIPRTEGDDGKTLIEMFPKAPPIGSVEPDFAKLGALAEALSEI